MEIRSFYKNQRELATSLNSIIDLYWEEKVGETELIEFIDKIYINNTDKIIKDGHFTKILLQQCGKKRVQLISKIISRKGMV